MVGVECGYGREQWYEFVFVKSLEGVFVWVMLVEHGGWLFWESPFCVVKSDEEGEMV